MQTKPITTKENQSKQNQKNFPPKDVSSAVILLQNPQEEEALNFALLFAGLDDGFTEPEIKTKKPQTLNLTFVKEEKVEYNPHLSDFILGNSNRCIYCGDDCFITVDHVIPISYFGDTRNRSVYNNTGLQYILVGIAIAGY